MELHILELPKFLKPPAQLADPLDVWLYFLRHGQHLDTEQLPAPLNISEIHRALEDLSVVTQSELEHFRYEDRLKAKLDEQWRREGGPRWLAEKAAAEARAEGRAEARAEDLVRFIQFGQRLLKHPPTPSEALQALSLEELERLAEQLEKEVSQP